jgi:hypothetical protein
MSVTPQLGTNPSGTTLAIYRQEGATCTGSGGVYLAANGSSNGATAVWQTAATWGTVQSTGLDAEKTYSFCVKAKNGNNIETAFSAGFSDQGASIPISGDLVIRTNISSGCSVGNRYIDGANVDRFVCGVDSGTTTNTAKITLQDGGSFTIQSNETLVTGTLELAGQNTTLFLPAGAQMKIGSNLYVLDQDGDGYPGNNYVYVGTVKPTISGKTTDMIRRKNAMTTLAVIDCDDTNGSVTAVCTFCGAGDTPSTVGSDLYGTFCKKCVNKQPVRISLTNAPPALPAEPTRVKQPTATVPELVRTSPSAKGHSQPARDVPVPHMIR